MPAGHPAGLAIASAAFQQVLAILHAGLRKQFSRLTRYRGSCLQLPVMGLYWMIRVPMHSMKATGATSMAARVHSIS